MRIAAFGVPAVPDVKSSTAGSSDAALGAGRDVVAGLVEVDRHHVAVDRAQQRLRRTGREREPRRNGLELPLELVRWRPRVQRHRDPTRLQDRQVRDDELLVVRARERDPIPGRDPAGQQRPREPPDEPFECVVRGGPRAPTHATSPAAPVPSSTSTKFTVRIVRAEPEETECGAAPRPEADVLASE